MQGGLVKLVKWGCFSDRLSARTEGRGGSAKCRQLQTEGGGRGGQKSLKMCGHLLWMVPLHTPLLRSEGPLVLWNFEQINSIIKDDNWCQSWLDFSDLNPNFDDIIQTDLISPIYFIHEKLLVTNLQVYRAKIYYKLVKSLNFQTRAISFLSYISGLHLSSRVCIWTEMKSLAHEISSFCKSVLNISLIKAQKANLSMYQWCTSPWRKHVLFLWLEGATINWVASSYKFNISPM